VWCSGHLAHQYGRGSDGLPRPGWPLCFFLPLIVRDDIDRHDNGSENRVASIRFSIFSAGGLGDAAVLGPGRPSLDV
jgi:hypothetical protein